MRRQKEQPEPAPRLKRVLVFVGDDYYPGGGWHDFHGSYDTVEEAKLAVIRVAADWVQIVDTLTGTVVTVDDLGAESEWTEETGL